MKYRTVLTLVLLFLYCAGCTLPENSDPGRQAWIDAPLDGSSLPLAPYEIVFHAYAPVNPAAVELTINGTPIWLDAVSLDQSLVTIRYPWYPTQPGAYLIAVRTQDGQGIWSSAHTHTVTIAGDIVTEAPITITVAPPPIITVSPAPPPIITVTTGPLPVITVTALPPPVITVTVEAPPPVEQKPIVFYNNTGPKQISRGNCAPNQLTFDVTIDQPINVFNVTVFTRVQDNATGASTEWDGGTALDPLPGGGQFWKIINVNSINWPTSYPNATLKYQFVASARDGSVLERSQVYSDVTLIICMNPT